MRPSVPSQARSPWRRRLFIAALAMLAAFVLVTAVVGYVLSGLERPAIKSRLQAVLRGSGVELDYTVGRGSIWSGLHLEGLRVATPLALRGFAPELARIGSVDVRWGLSRLTRGRIDAIAVRDVDVVIVVDADGRTSLDLRPPAATQAPPSPPRPPSALLGDLLGAPLPLGEVTIDPVRLTVLRTAAGAVTDRFTFEGLRARVQATPVPGGGRVQLELGTPSAPLALRLTRAGAAAGLARASLALSATADPRRADATVDLRLQEQTFAPRVPVSKLIAIQVGAVFDPAHRRVALSLSRGELADGSLALTAELERADTGELVVRKIDGTVDPRRLLALAPPDLASALPQIGGGALDVHVEGLSLSPRPSFTRGGRATVKGRITDARADAGGAEVRAPLVAVDLRGDDDARFGGGVDVKLESLRWRGGAARAELVDADVGVGVRALRWGAEGARGEVTLRLGVRSAHATAGTLGADLDGLTLTARTALGEGAPGGTVAVRAPRVRAADGKRALVDDPLQADLKLAGLIVDPARPLAARGEAHLTAQLGALGLGLDARKAADAVDYELRADATSLALLARLAPASSVRVPWAQIGLRLRSSGRVEALAGAPQIRHQTELSLDHPEARAAVGKVAARTLSLRCRSSGGARRHEGELQLSLAGLRRDDQPLGDGALGGSFAFDAAAPSLRVHVDSSGAAAPGVSVEAQAGFDRTRHRLRLDATLGLRGLDPLAPLLAGIAAARSLRLPGLELEVSARGEVDGVIDAISPTGAVQVAAHPADRAHGELTLGLHARALSWHDQDRQISTPALDWSGVLRLDGDRRALQAELKLGELVAAFGPNRISVAGVSDALKLELVGDPLRGQTDLEDTMSVRALRQDLVPPYPTGDVRLHVHVHRDGDGIVRVPVLELENRAGGTALSLRGGVDLGENRRSLSLEGSLTQDLAKAWTARQQLVGKGTVSTRVHVESGDLRVFRTTSSLRAQGASLTLPQHKIDVVSMDGEVPVVADVVFADGKLRLLRDIQVNAYSELRFADQHPMLSRRSYLSIARVDTPWVTLAPIAGNLVVDNNVLSMSQLELGVRGGRISGSAVLAAQGGDTKIQLNVRASGVRSSKGEPFDGNAAIVVSAKQHSVQGRAEILRIGRRHLLDLLDVADPPRTDGAINRVRRVLALGYPDQVRLAFNRGFASAKITFGGLARLVKLDEIRGIPMGPIIDRVLEPFMDEEEEE